MPNTVYQYTNGYDKKRVLPALLKRVRWSSYPGTSTSGRFFDDGSFHALATEQNWKETQPVAAPEDWQTEADKFEKAVIARALNAVFSKPAQIEKTMLFEFSPAERPAELPENDLIGFEICVAPDVRSIVEIKKAIFHLDANSTQKVYLYELGNATPIWDQELVIVGGKYSEHALTGCILSYSDSKKIRYFFGYKKSELVGGAKPHRQQAECWNMTRCFAAVPATSSSIPFTETSVTKPAEAYGLNLQVASYRDFTDRIIDQPSAFDELLGLTGAAMIVEQVIFNARSNKGERILKDNQVQLSAQYDLMGALPIEGSPRIDGLRKRMAMEVAKLQTDFSRKTTGVVTLD